MKRNMLMLPMLLVSLIFVGCGSDTYVVEKLEHYWSFEGLLDDSTAVAKVELREEGHIDCTHFMGYDDGESFSNWISTDYYTVSVNKVDVKKRYDSEGDIPGFGTAQESVPPWAVGCSLVGTVDKRHYCVEKIFWDSTGYACGLEISDAKGPLDTLERPDCRSASYNLGDGVTFTANYLKVGDEYYEIDRGMFPSQRFRFKIYTKRDGMLYFEDARGNVVVYGGKP